MLTYLTEYDNIVKMNDELVISTTDAPKMTGGERDTLAEVITVLAEFRRAVR